MRYAAHFEGDAVVDGAFAAASLEGLSLLGLSVTLWVRLGGRAQNYVSLWALDSGHRLEVADTGDPQLWSDHSLLRLPLLLLIIIIILLLYYRSFLLLLG